jgi:hypothetical protein
LAKLPRQTQGQHVRCSIQTLLLCEQIPQEMTLALPPKKNGRRIYLLLDVTGRTNVGSRADRLNTGHINNNGGLTAWREQDDSRFDWMKENLRHSMATRNADTFGHRWRCGRLSRLVRRCCKPDGMMGSDKSAAMHGGFDSNASRSNKH